MPHLNFWHKSNDQGRHQPDQSPSGSGSGSDIDSQAVYRALYALGDAKGWSEQLAVLEREQALLLTDTAEQILNGLILQAQQSDDPSQQQQVSYFKFYLALLHEARTRGILTNLEEYEAPRQQMVQEASALMQTLLAWLNAHSARDSRRFLEAHPDLLDPRIDDLLNNLIAHYVGQSGRVETLRNHLDLLRDVRMHGSTPTAIHEGYVNAFGGLALDVPSWLEDVEHQLDELGSHGRRDQTAGMCVALLREAIVRAGREVNLAPEIRAELNKLLWDALLEAVNMNWQQRLEEGIVCLQAMLQVYTHARYPRQYASVQGALGNIYGDRTAGERQANLEQAIACYQEALRVYTLDAFPKQFAQAQNSLGRVYVERIAGERQTNLEQAIACYQEVLRVFTLDTFPELYAQTQIALGELYRDRIVGERQANLEQAIACCQEALRFYTQARYPHQYALIQIILGHTYRERIVGDRRSNLEQAIACCQEALRFYTLDAFPGMYAQAQNSLGEAYQERIAGERRANLEQAIACFQEALRIYTLEAFPVAYAMAQHDLGIVYAMRIAGERRANLEQAIACCQEALRVYTLEAFPVEYALTQANLGEAYRERIAGERRANLEQAIACSQEALCVYTLEAFPVGYAQTQIALGNAYSDRITGERRVNLEQAIACFQEALRVRTLAAFPEGYARAKTNLGGAYTRRIAGERRVNLEQAIACFQEAQRVYTLDAFPEQYALIQNSLGVAYVERIAGERRANLEQAIICFQEALRVRTLAAFPEGYAQTQTNHGGVYIKRIAGERWANLEQAITSYQEALRVYTLDAFPEQYAQTKTMLGVAYVERIAGERRANLEQAIICFQEALRVRTLAAFPEGYASTQHNLGVAYVERIAGERRANLEQAITSYQEALCVRTLDAFPELYAQTQTALGDAYRNRIAGERRANLELAIYCYQEALRVYTLDAFPHDHRQTQLHRAITEAARCNWADAHDAYSSALAAEDLLVTLGAGTIGRDVVLKEGHDAAVNDGFALIQLGKACKANESEAIARFTEAAVVIERGRARGLAEALALDAADPRLIRDAERRARYETAREHLIAAQKALNAPLPQDLSEDEQRRLNLAYTEAYQKAKAAFDAIIAEIHAARDPADFLEMTLNPSTILQAAERGGPGHALVYLAATPWGGIAVAALSANQSIPTPARFAALDLPSLTFALVSDLLQTKLSEKTQHLFGGFAHAQAGRGFGWVVSDWEGTTFRACAEVLHAACTAVGQTSTLDAAAQTILALPRLTHLVDQPLAALSDTDRGKLAGTLNHLFLSLEVQRCLEVLANTALRPLVAWLREQGARSLTLIPCGLIAAFPFAAVPMDDGRTMGEALPTSIAPSARSLLHNEQTIVQRAGVYALGDPWPTHQELQWGEAEAHTLAKLAGRLGLPSEVRVHEAATRAWLIETLQKGYIVDASCHGGFNIGEPLQSALLLAVGERLTLSDMLSHVADLGGLRLLILSACQTAILDLEGARDEVHSLAAGMVQAGAQAVLAALWSVDDKATYLLMVRFAQEWLPHLESESPAAALTRAQCWLRTVTNSELQTWHASNFPAATVEEQHVAGSQMLERDPWAEEAREPVGASKGEWRGLDRRSEAKETELSSGKSRYGISKAELLVQARGRNDPDTCPYADPIYWAGFQTTGW